METINLTPKWAEILPALVAVACDGNDEGRKLAVIELQRMAKAADSFNSIVPGMLSALEFVAFDGNVEMPAETAAIVQAAINTAKGV